MPSCSLYIYIHDYMYICISLHQSWNSDLIYTPVQLLFIQWPYIVRRLRNIFLFWGGIALHCYLYVKISKSQIVFDDYQQWSLKVVDTNQTPPSTNNHKQDIRLCIEYVSKQINRHHSRKCTPSSEEIHNLLGLACNFAITYANHFAAPQAILHPKP